MRQFRKLRSKIPLFQVKREDESGLSSTALHVFPDSMLSIFVQKLSSYENQILNNAKSNFVCKLASFRVTVFYKKHKWNRSSTDTEAEILFKNRN